MKRVIDVFKSLGYTTVALYLIDSHFMTDSAKFLSASLMCLSAMVQFELPHLNVITKMDLLGKAANSDELEKFVCLVLRFRHASCEF
jgi:hypothetical protein